MQAGTKKVSIYLDLEMDDVLVRRAKFNRRSLTQEISYLIEAALAAESNVDLGFLRNVLMSQGGVSSVPEAGLQE